MGRRQEWVYHVEPEEFPQDFPERLERFKQAAGLTWRGLARLLKVNARIGAPVEGRSQARPRPPGQPVRPGGRDGAAAHPAAVGG